MFPRNRSAILIAAMILTAAAASGASAQHEVGLRFDVGVPTGEFGDNAEDPGFGASLNYAYAVTENFSFGIGGNFLVYGSESRFLSIPLVEDVEVKTSNNLAGFFLMSQINLLTGTATPYIEGRFGGHYLWTESKLEDIDSFDSDDIGEEVNFDDFALKYGIGGGFRIRLGSADDGDNATVWLDMKAMFMSGGEAEYLTEGDIDVVGDRAILRPSKTKTNLTHFEVGVILAF